MGLAQLVRTRGYRNFMSKLYGWGASVVIIGALFKINHYTGADIMLIIGLGTESIIFFFSAFEPPHVEPDWSLVYPQLGGIYHNGVDEDGKPTGTVTQELDKMLEKAKIGPELVESLGNGLRSLSETTAQLSNVSNASVANDQYVSTLKNATESVSELSASYSKTAKTLNETTSVSETQLENMQAASKGAANLSGVYARVAETLNEEVTLNKDLNSSLANLADTSNRFVEKYNESAEILSKTTAALSHTATHGENYNEQLQKISSNLSALNAMYELNLQNSNEQMEHSNRFNQVLRQLVQNLDESSVNSGQYKENLAALNVAVVDQLQVTTKQVDITGQMHDSISQFLANMNESVERTGRFKDEVNTLAQNVAALNKVYGNMLSAMNANPNK
ncbi:MAG: gliding motility protein GldL [Bacteroidales bacterium]|nr:gliding motility protein GldL [Bacteroidales bacterium]